jgi:AmpD protein
MMQVNNEQTVLSLDTISGWVTGARHVPSPNCDERPVGCDIDVLVIHAISLPPCEFGGPWIEALFTNRLPADAHPYFADIHSLEVSAHFLIRRDGELLQFVPVHQRAWHAGQSCCRGRERVNDFSVGIELEGCDDIPFEAVQYRVLAKLSRLLLDSFPGLDEQAIYGHADIAPGRKTDPGPHFDWANYRLALSQTSITPQRA